MCSLGIPLNRVEQKRPIEARSSVASLIVSGHIEGEDNCEYDGAQRQRLLQGQRCVLLKHEVDDEKRQPTR